jgi:hypothetical protein
MKCYVTFIVTIAEGRPLTLKRPISLHQAYWNMATMKDDARCHECQARLSSSGGAAHHRGANAGLGGQRLVSVIQEAIVELLCTILYYSKI